MASRLKLHEEFCEILKSRNVYFKPPESMKMIYPCIRYKLSGVDETRANNKLYNSVNQYEVIVMDYDPDSEIHNLIRNHFPMCSFVTSYTKDNLNHVALKLFY